MKCPKGAANNALAVPSQECAGGFSSIVPGQTGCCRK
jgi:hypothetical protein